MGVVEGVHIGRHVGEKEKVKVRAYCAARTLGQFVRIWVLRVNNPVRYSSTGSRHATVLL